MKPRFSILTLLGITAYVAVNVAGVAYPSSVWRWLSGLCVIVAMICSCFLARNNTLPAVVLVVGSVYLTFFLRFSGGEATSMILLFCLLAIVICYIVFLRGI